MQHALLMTDADKKVTHEHFLQFSANFHNMKPKADVELPLDKTLDAHLEQLETELLIQALAKCQGNQIKAASSLGLSRGAFVYRMRKLNIRHHEL